MRAQKSTRGGDVKVDKDKCAKCAHRERCDFRAPWFLLWFLAGAPRKKETEEGEAK